MTKPTYYKDQGCRCWTLNEELDLWLHTFNGHPRWNLSWFIWVGRACANIDVDITRDKAKQIFSKLAELRDQEAPQ